ncbi:MAG: ComEC/Rec2 family competence protein [Gemmatimonadaceae bacterium]
MVLRRVIGQFALGLAIVASIWSDAAAQRRDSVLTITHFDVGQGDATLIVTPERRRVLIDAGPLGSGVAPRLKRLGIDTLDLVIASHNHADHIGGMPEIFAALVVLNYMDNGIPHTTLTYQRTIAAVAAERGLRYLQATERVVEVGSAALRVLPAATIDSSQNNNSVGVIVAYGEFTALFTGDSEQRQLTRWLRAEKIPRVTMVKSAHHGAANGASPRLYAATSPRVVVISAGPANRYGHPSPITLRGWAATSAEIYRTDIHGSVEVTATRDGRFTVRTSRPR